MRWTRRKLPVTTIIVIIMVAGQTALAAESTAYERLLCRCRRRWALI